jgi:serine/threonine protein phosphatase PrpC
MLAEQNNDSTVREGSATDEQASSSMLPKKVNNTLSVEMGGHSVAGVKAENQDAFAVKNPSKEVTQYKGIVACVADGVSCSEHAQLASHTAVSNFIEDYYSTPDSWPVKTAAPRILSALNDWLYRQGQATSARHNGLVTTFSSIIFKSQTAHIFHMGDSRIYRLRHSDLEQLTVDHTQLVRGDDVLTRALGIDSHLEVDYRKLSLEVGDLFILTTDGVHGVFSKQQFRAAVIESELLFDQNQNLEKRSQVLVEMALQQGSTDNLSCLLLKVSELPLENIDEVHRKLTTKVIPPVLDIGHKIDDYEVQKVIYSGTRSHLYLVKTADSNESYVLKAPSENFAEDILYLDGFSRENWVGQRINNSAIMKILPQQNNSNFLYHICEYIPGQTLRQWMHDNPQPSLDSVRSIVQGVIQGLRAIQRLGMVHRDIKPENIIITTEGQVKLIDFGTVLVGGVAEITSLLDEECPVGSVDYIAPEYLLGQQCSVRSDLFSLGVMVYEMLTGNQPFAMSHVARRLPTSYNEWYYQSAIKQRKDLPVWVDLCLQKSTNPNPNYRYAALSEFMMDLCTPNTQMLAKQESAPLLERDPVKFWQLISLILMAVVILQTILI